MEVVIDSSIPLNGRCHLDCSPNIGIARHGKATTYELSTLSHRIETNPKALRLRVKPAAIVADYQAQFVSVKLE